jgi:hypothetical protein
MNRISGLRRLAPLLFTTGGMIGCGVGVNDDESIRTEALPHDSETGGACVNPATCVTTDELTLSHITVKETISCPFHLGTWMSGGAATGIAPADFPNVCGLGFTNALESQASAINSLDHHWLQTTSSPIVMDMGAPVNTAFVFSSMDHGPFPEEGIDSTVWGSNSPNTVGFPAGWTLGTLTTIWSFGWEDPLVCRGMINSDDFTGEYSFPGAGFRFIAVHASGSISIFRDPTHTTSATENDDFDTLGWQSQNNEIDAVGAPVCGPDVAVAKAGPDQVSSAPNQICFDGSGSSAAAGTATVGWDVNGDGAIDQSGNTACIPCTAAGEGDVRLFVTDRCGCGASDTAHWKCVTSRPPDCSGARSSVDELRPPNHQLHDVSVTGVTDPDGDPIAILITSIRQDEPVDGRRDGDTCPDGKGVGTSTARVRAERSGNGDGRVYHIGFKASDGRDGSCTGEVTTCAPHDRDCVDGGAQFDSTVCP